MKIDGHTKVCGLIGNPVEHTLSPFIQNRLAEKSGCNMVYASFRVEDGREEVAIRGGEALHIAGFNVTVPYKSSIMPYLAEIDKTAQLIGAVNTLVPVKFGYKGYNTDMEGLYRAMKSDGISLEKEEVIVLGAGGAARAVAFLCALKGAKKVYLLNRTIEKAEKVAAEVESALGYHEIHPVEMKDYAKIPLGLYLAIQATSVGLYPQMEQTPMDDVGFYQMLHTGYDLIYRPERTRFMELAELHGARAYNGLKMLLYQAVIAYEIWNQVTITQDWAEEIYEELKGELNGK